MAACSVIYCGTWTGGFICKPTSLFSLLDLLSAGESDRWNPCFFLLQTLAVGGNIDLIDLIAEKGRAALIAAVTVNF